jgi:chromate reductase, NAD(P)H dehydrogenase (quinone)
MTSVLALSGSLRAQSFNTRILGALGPLAPDGLRVDLFDVADLPLYNQDDDAEVLPDSAARLRAAVAAADGVVIATPEYNHSYSAVAKNFIDWASRPFAAGPLLKKPVMLIAAGPGPSGGVHALEATSTLMTLLGCPIVASVGVAGAQEKIHEDGHIIDENLAQQLRMGLAGFIN